MYAVSAKMHLRNGFPGGSVVRNSPANAGGEGSIPGLERSPGEANGNTLLKNSMDRGAYGPWGNKESDTHD